MIIPRYLPYYNIKEIQTLFDREEDTIKKFEQNFAKTVGSKYALSFPRGLSALYTLIKSLEIKDKEVIIPSYVCAAVPHVIIASGNTPRFAEISLKDYNITLNNCLNNITNNTKIIMPVHMYGYPFNIKKLKEKINDEILIVEDAALAFLAKDVGKYGDATFYSFDIFKQIFTCGGGILTTNNKEIYDKLVNYIEKNFNKKTFFKEFKKLTKFICSYILFKKPFYEINNLYEEFFIDNYYSKDYSIIQNDFLRDFYNYYSGIQAKVGMAQLEKSHEMVKKTTQIAKFYDEKLSNKKNITIPPMVKGASYSMYTIRVKNRDKFKKHMQKKGIYVNNLWQYSIPHIPQFKKYVVKDVKNKGYANSLLASKQVVNLPNYPSLYDNSNKLEYIVKTIGKIIK